MYDAPIDINKNHFVGQVIFLCIVQTSITYKIYMSVSGIFNPKSNLYIALILIFKTIIVF